MFIYHLTEEEKVMILNSSSCLKDCHIDKFHNLLQLSSSFKPKTTLYTSVFVNDPQCTRFEPLPRHLPHLQILHSCDNNCFKGKCQNGHWVCMYYDTKQIFIYDSLNIQKLHSSHEIFLTKLFPHFYNLQVSFPKVQSQSNAVDCGVFAIAFATSIYFKQSPCTTTYDETQMRKHLLFMYQTNNLKSFPELLNCIEQRFIQNIGLNNNYGSSADLKECKVVKNSQDLFSGTWKVIGIENKDRISCYAISTLQSLFHCPSIRSQLLNNSVNDVLQEALQTYASGGSLSIKKVKSFAGCKFILNEHADAADFIIGLCRQSKNLQASLEFMIKVEVGCRSCNIMHKSESRSNYILSLSIPKNEESASLQKIIDFNLDQWAFLGITCDRQRDHRKCMRKSVQTSNDILILKLMTLSFNNGGKSKKINDIQLKSFEKEVILISKNMYRVRSAICYISSLPYGHYTNLLRESNGWRIVDDLKVSLCPTFPHADGVYIIFLEKISKPNLLISDKNLHKSQMEETNFSSDKYIPKVVAKITDNMNRIELTEKKVLTSFLEKIDEKIIESRKKSQHVQKLKSNFVMKCPSRSTAIFSEYESQVTNLKKNILINGNRCDKAMSNFDNDKAIDKTDDKDIRIGKFSTTAEISEMTNCGLKIESKILDSKKSKTKFVMKFPIRSNAIVPKVPGSNNSQHSNYNQYDNNELNNLSNDFCYVPEQPQKKRKLDGLSEDVPLGLLETDEASIGLSKIKRRKESCLQSGRDEIAPHIAPWKIIGIQNPVEMNGTVVSCYAISSLQSLFNCPSVRFNILNNPYNDVLQQALQVYASGGNVDIQRVRAFAGNDFSSMEQKDAAEFITVLCLECTYLQSSLCFNFITDIQCHSCDYRNRTVTESNCILPLSIPMNKKDISLQEIINNNLEQWTDIEGPCEKSCNGGRQLKTSIATENDILILQLMIYDERLHKVTGFQLTPFNNEIINVAGITYQVKSAVIHHGHSIEFGHYTTVLRQSNNWMIANDMHISLRNHLLNDGDAYLIFLEKVFLPNKLINSDIGNQQKYELQIENRVRNLTEALQKNSENDVSPKKIHSTSPTTIVNDNSVDKKIISESITHIPVQQNLPRQNSENKRKLDEFLRNQQSDYISQARRDLFDDGLNRKKLKISQLQCGTNTNDSWNINIIEGNNEDSYAISSIQSLFHSPSIRSKFFSNPEENFLQESFRIYASGGKLSVMIVKLFAGCKYIQNKCRDVAEFITQLCLNSENLKSSLYFDIDQHIACTHCDTFNGSIDVSNYVLSLLLPNHQNYTSLQEIINYNLNEWVQKGTSCECGAVNNVRSFINATSVVLILQIILYQSANADQLQKMNIFQFVSLRNELISISGEMYRVQSAILHHGSSQWPMQGGHYSNILRRSNDWVHVDNTQMQSCVECPKEGNPYIIFLEKVDSPVNEIEQEFCIGFNVTKNEVLVNNSDSQQYDSPNLSITNTAPTVLFQSNSIIEELSCSNSQMCSMKSQPLQLGTGINYATPKDMVDVTSNLIPNPSSDKISKQRSAERSQKYYESHREKILEARKLQYELKHKLQKPANDQTLPANIDHMGSKEFSQQSLLSQSSTNDDSVTNESFTDNFSRRFTSSAPTLTSHQPIGKINKKSSVKMIRKHYDRKYYKSHKQVISDKRKIQYRRNQNLQKSTKNKMSKTKMYQKYAKKVKRKLQYLKHLQNKQMARDSRLKKIMYYLSKKTSILEKRKRLSHQTPQIRRRGKKVQTHHSTRHILQSKEYYVNKIVRNINCPSLSALIEAEQIVTAVIYARDQAIEQVKKCIGLCKNKVEVSLARLGNESINGNELFAATALCGLAKHSSKAEAYFAETSYDFKHAFRNLENIVINTLGQSTNILPLDSVTTWFCNENCKTLDADILQTLVDLLKSIRDISYNDSFQFFRDIDICSCESRNPKKMGHPKICYNQPLSCKSMFLKLSYLSSHYPWLRTMKRIIYRIKAHHQSISRIDNALNTHDIDELKDIAKSFNDIRTKFHCSDEVICLDEVKIRETYKTGIIEYQKIDRDPPATPCISCERLCCLRNMTSLQNCAEDLKVGNYSYNLRKRKPVEYVDHEDDVSEESLENVEDEKDNAKDPSFKLPQREIWTKFLQLYDPLKIASSFICNSCKQNFDKNYTPSNCILNKLSSVEVPSEIAVLNDFEKMLIQRAKAFQTIVKKDTVMKKQLPHYVKIDKVVGGTFHLPLPIEETLKKICPAADSLMKDQDMYVLVRGNPTKDKVMWEDYVDVRKIWAALHWLKLNNPLYENIVIPTDPVRLLDNVQDCGVDDENKDVTHDSIANDLVKEKNKDCSIQLIQNGDNIQKPPQTLLQSLGVNDKNEEEVENADLHGLDGKLDDVLVKENEKENHASEKPRALVTQKSASDAFYNQYTIYPLYNESKNIDDLTLYQMLNVYATAIDSRKKELDLMCFPDLFPTGRHGMYETREFNLRESDFIKSKLTSKHSRYRLNKQYLFYLLYNHNRRQIGAGIFHKLNIMNPQYQWTAGDLQSMKKDDNLESNIDSIFSRIRGTEAYWKQPRNELNCMMREYGPSTFFITFSPGKWMWSEAGEYIRNVNGWSNHKSTSACMADDPVSAARFIHNRFKATLKYIYSSANPIGKAIHHYYVREYQGRGLPHFHCIFWIQGAPVFGKSSNEEVKNFILKYITCRIPDKRISPELYRRVMAYQQHKHNNYCMRKKKTACGFVSACRFGFSRPVTKDLILRNVDVAISNRHKLRNNSRFYDLPRNLEEQNVNDYMPSLLAIWEGNMDAQYIGESSYLLTRYVCSYGTKGEKSNIDYDLSEMKNNKSLCSRLWSIGLRSLNHRECGAIEAADTLLAHPLHATDKDTVFRWLNTNIVRSRRLKTFEEIKLLPPESTDIFFNNFIDTYYPIRHQKLEKLCLYDFAKWFDIKKSKPKYNCESYKIGDNLYCVKRSKPYLINHCNHNPITQPEAYYHSLLLLFLPWRDVDQLKGSESTYLDSFIKKKDVLTEAMKYHDKSESIREAIDNMTKLIENQMMQNNEASDLGNQNLPDGCDPIEIEQAMKDFEDAADKVVMSKDALENNINKLNVDQNRVFTKAKEGLFNEEKPLRLVVFGSGGTGKSHIIESIVALNKLQRQKKTLILAPTGIAAYNVNGLTIHKALQIPVEPGITAKYKELSHAAIKRIRQSLKDVDLIIIDEISMVSDVLFMYIHFRLTQINNTCEIEDGWFGKINIIIFGDLLQLPPVNEDFVFVELTKHKITKYVGAVGSYDLWSLFDFDELTINMRQRNDKMYSEILGRIRMGIVTKPDIEILEKRMLPFSGGDCLANMKELCESFEKLPANAVCLLPTRNMCKNLNDAMLRRIDSEEITLVANDCFKCPQYLRKKVNNLLNKDEGNECGIDRTITIKIGCKIMIRRNIDVSIGLVNGTIGTVVSVSKDDAKNITSINIQLTNGREYPISRLEYQFVIMKNVFIIRQQFPICCSFGITIHKSQGLSLDNAVIDAGNDIFNAGQTYVALSRVTKLEGLHLINFDPSSIFAKESAVIEYNRIRKIIGSREELIPIPDNNQNKEFMVRDNKWSVPLQHLLVQSNNPANAINDDYWKNLRGLPNGDGVSSYANVCIQTILHCDEVRLKLMEQKNVDVIKLIFNQYIAKDSTDIRELRNFISQEYSLPIVHDASTFLQDLCKKFSMFEILFAHELRTVIKCFSCNAREEEVRKENFILKLYTPDTSITYTLQQIIDSNLGNWLQKELPCQNPCMSTMHQRVDISYAKNLILIQFCDTNIRIKDVPRSKIRISNRYYNVISGIFHSSDDLKKCSYHNMLKRDNYWFKVTDSSVEKKSWPKCAKGAFIFLLREIVISKNMR